MQWETANIRMRDPFVLPVREENCYYLFGTTDANCWDVEYGRGFDSYRSTDLEHWEGPFMAFSRPADFPAVGNFWAPEVHRYKGRYYMFASFKSPDSCRGTMILASDRPEGPYKLHSHGFVTPAEWESLDGTLWVDADCRPWLVFCHEWVQIDDGTICAVPLSEDLRRAAGAPVKLFTASEAPWVRPVADDKSFVTDGPFLFEKDGKLFMLWSSFSATGYAMGLLEAVDGRVDGEWVSLPEPLFAKDGGHGMRFRAFDGKEYYTVHQPNRTPFEHPVFLPV